MPKAAEKPPRKLAKEVYTSGLSRKEDKAVIKDYAFVWDGKYKIDLSKQEPVDSSTEILDSGNLKKLVVNYRHFQDSEALYQFFKKENEVKIHSLAFGG